MLRRWFAAFAALTLCVLIEGFLSWQDGWLTYGQMRTQGIEQGIFFLGHPGMWMDFFVVNPLLAVMVAKYGEQWTWRQGSVIAVLAIALSAGMHYQYSLDKFPTAFGHNGLPPTGTVHFVYMAAVFVIVALFYTCTTHSSRAFVLVASGLLLVHVVIGVYVPLKLWTPPWFPQHGIWNALTLVPIGVSALLLGGLSWFALRDRKEV